MKNNEKISPIPEISDSAIFRTFFANLIEISTNGIIFWNLSRNSEKKSTKISEKKRKNRRKKCRKIGKMNFHFFIRPKILTIFGWNFEVWAVQKYVDLVDLVKTFPTNIYLQRSASIQPRMSLSKFWGDFSFLFIRLLSAAGASSTWPLPQPCAHQQKAGSSSNCRLISSSS